VGGTRMSDLPAPFVASNVDLRDFKFMPLEVERLRRSRAWLKATRKPELGFYMLNLWAGSWHEIPCGSLEDDDDVLAAMALCEPRKWLKVREDVLHGWVKCSDGKLYHPVVAEKAREAWEAKVKQRERTDAARRAKSKKPTPVTESVTDPVTASKGQGHAKSLEEERDIQIPNPTSARARAEATGQDKKSGGEVGSVGSGKWALQENRDAFAHRRITEQLTRDGHRSPWDVLMSAEDENNPEYEMACRRVRAAAKAAGVGWISPHLRKGRAA
jgi:Protein of unknown function (DUF1376)